MQQALIYLVKGVFQQVVFGGTAALGGVRRALGACGRGGERTREGVGEVVEISFFKKQKKGKKDRKEKKTFFFLSKHLVLSCVLKQGMQIHPSVITLCCTNKLVQVKCSWPQK